MTNDANTTGSGQPMNDLRLRLLDVEQNPNRLVLRKRRASYFLEPTIPAAILILALTAFPAGVSIWIILPTAAILLTLGYVVQTRYQERNPLTFDKQADQLRKGRRVVAKLSSVKCVAVVFQKYTQQRWQKGYSDAKVFVRFAAEPWSIQIDIDGRRETADRMAALLADFLCVPAIEDPIRLAHPQAQRSLRGR